MLAMINRAVIGEYLERLNTNAGVNIMSQLDKQLFASWTSFLK